MLLAGEENLREVTMFPMTQQAQDLLMNAPSPANPKQLKELHLRVVYPKSELALTADRQGLSSFASTTAWLMAGSRAP
jgi:hypothetical protein